MNRFRKAKKKTPIVIILLPRKLDENFNNPINFATSKGITILELAKLIKKMMNLDVDILFGAKASRPYDIQQLVGSFSLANEVLGWKPKTLLRDGIQKTIKWMKCHYKNYITRGE